MYEAKEAAPRSRYAVYAPTAGRTCAVQPARRPGSSGSATRSRMSGRAPRAADPDSTAARSPSMSRSHPTSTTMVILIRRHVPFRSARALDLVQEIVSIATLAALEPIAEHAGSGLPSDRQPARPHAHDTRRAAGRPAGGHRPHRRRPGLPDVAGRTETAAVANIHLARELPPSGCARSASRSAPRLRRGRSPLLKHPPIDYLRSTASFVSGEGLSSPTARTSS